MLVRESSLVLRFYVSDGWSRAVVSEYLVSRNIHFVIPRYFDYEEDQTVKSFQIIENALEFPDCDYYAVYSLCKEATIDIKKLEAEHEVKSFGGSVLSSF